MASARVYGQVATDEPRELQDVCSDREDEFSLEELPPMPTPDYMDMRQEACCGCVLVLSLTFLLVGFTRSVALNSGLLPATVHLIVYILIHAEAVVAMICLAGIMFGDPGVITRSKETTFPLPKEVAQSLREGRILEKKENIWDSEGEQSFCVRCFVWRPPDSHHCKTCGRCVRDFDHHCGVFGRCIAGRGFCGNMGYFTVILWMLFAGFLTCAFSAVAVSAKAENTHPQRRSPRLKKPKPRHS